MCVCVYVRVHSVCTYRVCETGDVQTRTKTGVESRRALRTATDAHTSRACAAHWYSGWWCVGGGSERLRNAAQRRRSHGGHVQTPTIKLFAATRRGEKKRTACARKISPVITFIRVHKTTTVCVGPTPPDRVLLYRCVCRFRARRRECSRGGVAADRASEPRRVGGGGGDDNRFSPSPYRVQLFSCRAHTCGPSVKWYANVYVLQTTCGMHVHCDLSLECAGPLVTGDLPNRVGYDVQYFTSEQARTDQFDRPRSKKNLAAPKAGKVKKISP